MPRRNLTPHGEKEGCATKEEGTRTPQAPKAQQEKSDIVEQNPWKIEKAYPGSKRRFIGKKTIKEEPTPCPDPPTPLSSKPANLIPVQVNPPHSRSYPS
jgi:hypothetical protein